MIEQGLRVVLDFIKEIWSQLDSQFGLEETEAFKFIRPSLLQLQDNPTYMGIAFAALVLVPFGLYKLYKMRSISRERERKFDDLMEEMEEDELDENDPNRLRRPAPAEETKTAEAEEDDEEDDLKEPPETNNPAPEPLSLETLDLTDEVEPTIERIEPVIQDIESVVPPLQPVPERDYTIDGRPDQQADSLINRLKYLQKNLDTRFHHDEKPELNDEKPELPPARKKIDFAGEHQSFATKKAPVDNKKYIEVLESFIFLKDQNKHK